MDLDPGYEVLTEVDIVTSVVAAKEDESSDEEEVMEVPKVKLSALRTYIDALLDYSTCSQLPEMAHYYGNFRIIQEAYYQKAAHGDRQTKISSFFGPRRPVQDGAPASHFPSILGTPLAPKDWTNAEPCYR